MNRRNLTIVGLVAVVLLVIVAIVLVRRDDSTTVNANGSTTTTVNGSTTTAVPLPASYPHIWPFGASGIAPPEKAAQSFAADYLGMTHARVGKTTTTAQGATVEVFPNAGGTARTLVQLVQIASGWVVIGANADEIVVDEPPSLAAIDHPIHVSGTSTAFEAQIGLELRAANSKDAVAHGTAMGGANGEMGPFNTTITPPAGDGPLVLIVFEGDASGQQTYTKATVVLLGTGQDVTKSAAPN